MLILAAPLLPADNADTAEPQAVNFFDGRMACFAGSEAYAKVREVFERRNRRELALERLGHEPRNKT